MAFAVVASNIPPTSEPWMDLLRGSMAPAAAATTLGIIEAWRTIVRPPFRLPMPRPRRTILAVVMILWIPGCLAAAVLIDSPLANWFVDAAGVGAALRTLTVLKLLAYLPIPLAIASTALSAPRSMPSWRPSSALLRLASMAMLILLVAYAMASLWMSGVPMRDGHPVLTTIAVNLLRILPLVLAPIAALSGMLMLRLIRMASRAEALLPTTPRRARTMARRRALCVGVGMAVLFWVGTAGGIATDLGGGWWWELLQSSADLMAMSDSPTQLAFSGAFVGLGMLVALLSLVPLLALRGSRGAATGTARPATGGS